MAQPIQQHTFAAYVTVGGRELPGSWDKVEGGDIKTEAKTYRPGGMVGEIPLPAPSTTENVTVTRYFDAGRDGPLDPWLRSVADSAPASIAVQILGADKQPVGSPTVYNGFIAGYKGPEFDSTSDGDVAEMSIEVVVATP